MESYFGCVMRCKKKLNPLSDPWPVDPIYGGPEYETLAALGSNCVIDSVEAISDHQGSRTLRALRY